MESSVSAAAGPLRNFMRLIKQVSELLTDSAESSPDRFFSATQVEPLSMRALAFDLSRKKSRKNTSLAAAGGGGGRNVQIEREGSFELWRSRK